MNKVQGQRKCQIYANQIPQTTRNTCTWKAAYCCQIIFHWHYPAFIRNFYDWKQFASWWFSLLLPLGSAWKKEGVWQLRQIMKWRTWMNQCMSFLSTVIQCTKIRKFSRKIRSQHVVIGGNQMSQSFQIVF